MQRVLSPVLVLALLMPFTFQEHARRLGAYAK